MRGIGLGRWLVEESIRYCRACGFNLVYLWTVQGLDRAISIYESVGFTRVAEKSVEEWGKTSLEIRFDLTLASANRAGLGNLTTAGLANSDTIQEFLVPTRQ